MFHGLMNNPVLGGGSRTEGQRVATPLPALLNTNSEKTQIYIHASSGIRIHDRSVRVEKVISQLRLQGHCNHGC
jgi:hypothetical protein